jgi:hypothetical protein
MTTVTRTQNRRSLLSSTQLPVNSSKTVSSLTRSGTTATATSTSHGFSTGDWIMIQGSDRPPYNGPFQIASTGSNTFTYVMESDPGASSAGSVTAIKAIAASIWGDGTTVDGNVTIGALPSALGGDVVARVSTTTAPTTACRISIFRSPTAQPGTWRVLAEVDSTITANDQSTHVINIPRGSFVLIVFWRVAGTAVYCDAVGNEETSLSS